jgi:hypothetical protein
MIRIKMLPEATNIPECNRAILCTWILSGEI